MDASAFGDTFGYDGDICHGAGGPNWRSNTFASAADCDPANGVRLTAANVLVSVQSVHGVHNSVPSTRAFSPKMQRLAGEVFGPDLSTLPPE